MTPEGNDQVEREQAEPRGGLIIWMHGVKPYLNVPPPTSVTLRDGRVLDLTVFPEPWELIGVYDDGVALRAPTAALALPRYEHDHEQQEYATIGMTFASDDPQSDLRWFMNDVALRNAKRFPDRDYPGGFEALSQWDPTNSTYLLLYQPEKEIWCRESNPKSPNGVVRCNFHVDEMYVVTHIPAPARLRTQEIVETATNFVETHMKGNKRDGE